jgi:hypothetical protein
MPTVPLALNGYDAQPTTVVPLLSHRRDSQRAHAPPPPIKQVRRTMVNIQSHRHDLPPSCQTGAMPDTNAHTQPPLPSNSAMLSPRPWIPQAAVASPSHTPTSPPLPLSHTVALVYRRPHMPLPPHRPLPCPCTRAHAPLTRAQRCPPRIEWARRPTADCGLPPIPHGPFIKRVQCPSTRPPSIKLAQLPTANRGPPLIPHDPSIKRGVTYTT